MDSSSNPALALLGFWMFLQLVAFLALLWGGIYLLFCLNRASSSLDRLATAAERWLEEQRKPLPGQGIPAARETPVPAVPATPVPASVPVWHVPEASIQPSVEPTGHEGGASH